MAYVKSSEFERWLSRLGAMKALGKTLEIRAV
jgi:hypothetical protein